MHFKTVLPMHSVGLVLKAESCLVSTSLSPSHRTLKCLVSSGLCVAMSLDQEPGKGLKEWLCAYPKPLPPSSVLRVFCGLSLSSSDQGMEIRKQGIGRWAGGLRRIPEV